MSENQHPQAAFKTQVKFSDLEDGEINSQFQVKNPKQLCFGKLVSRTALLPRPAKAGFLIQMS